MQNTTGCTLEKHMKDYVTSFLYSVSQRLDIFSAPSNVQPMEKRYVCVCAYKCMCGGLYFLGMDINEEAARVIEEGLDECALWEDVNVQALLMVKGAKLKAQRGKTDDSVVMLQVPTLLLFCCFLLLLLIYYFWICNNFK